MEASAQSIILLCSDERISRSVQSAIADHGNRLQVRGKSSDSVAYAINNAWDLLIVHTMDDHSFALETCRRIKSEKPFTQIIVISESANSESIAQCLYQGADDFIAIPWSSEEFLARINVAINRYQKIQQIFNVNDVAGANVTPLPEQRIQQPDEILLEADASASPYLNSGDVKLCTIKREVSVRDSALRLTRTEYSLMAYLMERVSRPCSSVELLNNVLGYENENYLPSLHSHVSRLRRKLGDSRTTTIETIWCFGYRLLIS